MNTTIKTTELALAAKLLREGCKMLSFETVPGRGRTLVEFEFEYEDPELINDFRTGADGVTQYETCRKMLMRIIDDQTRQHRQEPQRHGNGTG